MGSKYIKETGEIVFYNDMDVDSITKPTKGSSSVIVADEVNITKPNCLFNGFTKKNQGTTSYFKGRKIYDLNSRGKIKDMYKDEPKSIILTNL